MFAALATFFTYSCMYAYRRAFSAATFEGVSVFSIGSISIGFKTACVIAQVLGYMLSKFIGIKLIAEAKPNVRRKLLLAFIGVAWLALAGFAYVPTAIKPLFMFINGIPLGLVWGLVFSHIEGRRFTEVMGAVLCTSFALASGFVKSIGTLLLGMGVTSFEMPLVVGAIFAVPMLLSVWLLGQIPPPTKDDVDTRMERVPMTATDRKHILKNYLPGLVLLIIPYIFLSAYRDFRDSFMPEIFKGLGFGGKPQVFTQTELTVTLSVTLVLAFIAFIINNKKAFFTNLTLVFIGVALAGLSTLAFSLNMLPPLWWITLTGFSAYLAYIPYNAFLFERMIALYKLKANAGFFIYLADSFGYLGVVFVTLYKDLFSPALNHLSFFMSISYALAIGGGLFILLGASYFWRRAMPL